MKTGFSVGDPLDLRSLATALTGVEQSNHLERAAHAPEQEALWCGPGTYAHDSGALPVTFLTW